MDHKSPGSHGCGSVLLNVTALVYKSQGAGFKLWQIKTISSTMARCGGISLQFQYSANEGRRTTGLQLVRDNYMLNPIENKQTNTMNSTRRYM